MTPAPFDFELYRGDYHSWSFVLWQDEEKTIPVDLTGCIVRSQIRDKPKPDGVTLATLQTNVSLPNMISIQLLSEMWDDPGNQWPSKTGFWDFEVEDSVGQIRTYVAGKVRITPDITDVDI